MGRMLRGDGEGWSVSTGGGGGVRPGAGGHTSSRMRYVVLSLVCTLSSYSTLRK